MRYDGPGRPTKWSIELQEAIVDALRKGNYLDAAASMNGVAKQTVYRWMERGRNASTMLEEGAEVEDGELRYLDFCDAVEKARAIAENRNVQLVQRAAMEGTWQAAAWFLERTNRKHWGRHESVEIAGTDGQPIKVEHDASADLVARFAEMEKRALDAIKRRRGQEDDDES